MYRLGLHSDLIFNFGIFLKKRSGYEVKLTWIDLREFGSGSGFCGAVDL
jgi:hypothetical protein